MGDTMNIPVWQERTALLIGEEGLEKLRNATVVVAGLGGVGAYAAEMVARAGVGRLVLIDSDVVGESNKNRQLLAMNSTIGRSKVAVMRERLQDVNPELDIREAEEYLAEENIPEILSRYIPSGGTSNITSNGVSGGDTVFLVDAIDTLAPKIALISYCVNNKIPLVSSMGAGAKFDATKVRIADISKSYNCPLAYILRKKLRKIGISKGFPVVFSEELPEREAIVPTEGERNKKSQVGTISYLPAVFGCVCAQAAISCLLKD